MGRDTEQRPFKSYYARYAREAYPAMGMGRELLTLNLGFGRVAALPPEAMPGEAVEFSPCLFQRTRSELMDLPKPWNGASLLRGDEW